MQTKQKKLKKFTLFLLPEKLGICHFDKNHSIPDWAIESEFFSINKTPDELSILCSENKIPGGVLAEKNWRVFQVKGPLGFSLTGIVSFLSTILAKAGISILYVSTYETDYIFVQEEKLEKVKEIFKKYCHLKEK
ncbi:MAG: ACT domain-containing protein [Patescibacteria group bacterium]|nr:ACT domain-containing protein [Patescibacteria group bacterium]